MKVFYEVDPHNRLILKRPKTRSRLKRFRQVVYGTFKTDKKNALYYEVFKSSQTSVPQKIKFSGTYSLDKKHNLLYTLDKWSNQHQGNRLRLRTKLVNADAGEIVFLVSSRKAPFKKRSIYIINLQGAWQVDRNNRLTFGVRRGRNKKDSLTLYNAWNINRNNEIIYGLGRTSGVITLKGRWRIKDRYALGYILDKRINSGFNFRTSLGRVVPRGKKTYIRFDVAIDVSKRERIKRRIIFTYKARLTKGKKIIVEVSQARGAKFRLEKRILNKKGIAYIEALFKDRERYLGAGVAFKW